MRSIDLPNDLSSVRLAREFVRAALTRQGIASDEPVLVVSELATNVIRHARTDFTVHLDTRPGRIRIEVENGAGAQAVAVEMGQDVGGVGLQIVQSLARDWGLEVHGDRKTVWVELEA